MNKKTYTTSIVFSTFIVALAVINFSIAKKEDHLTHGKTIYLKLAPVDPRSIMQGDYMALNFAVGAEILKKINEEVVQKNQAAKKTPPSKALTNSGLAVLSQVGGVSVFDDFYHGQALNLNQTLVRYRIKGWRAQLGTDAYFFQEGQAHLYEKATVGQFKVAKDGELLLIAMCDDDLKPIKPILGQSSRTRGSK